MLLNRSWILDRPHFSPRELLAANAWTSLLFTTYSLSLSFLETVPLAAVARSYRNFTVLTDIEGYFASLADLGAVAVGREYDLYPMKLATGIFHPKISLMADKEGNIRATVGSGNLTFGGWGNNNEIVDVLRPGRDAGCFADLAEMLEGISRESNGGSLDCLSAPDLEPFIAISRQAAAVPGDGGARLLHTMNGPLIPQIESMANELGGASKLVVVSPFFSTHRGVAALSGALKCDDISVAVPSIIPSMFDFDAAHALGFHVKPVISNSFNDNRSVHAKLFDIECAHGRLLISGSANATLPALNGSNIEAVVARTYHRQKSFGWTTTTSTKVSVITCEKEPGSSAGGAGLVARYEAETIFGRVMGGQGTFGKWEVYLASGARRVSAGMVEVADDGTFSIKRPPNMHPLLLGTSMQVIFVRSDTELRGWLIFQALITSMAERGPVSRAFSRKISGVDSIHDVVSIIEYLSHESHVVMDAVARTGGGRADRESSVKPLLGAASFSTKSAVEMVSTLNGLGGARSADVLIDALIRHLATALPTSNDDTANDDEEIDDNAGRQPSPRGPPRKNSDQNITSRLPSHIIRRAFNKLFQAIDKVDRRMRTAGLFLLYDMITQIVPRTDAEDSLLQEYLNRWLSMATGTRPADGDCIGIDRCVSVAVTRLVMGDVSKAIEMHSFLQAWTSGRIDEEFKSNAQPNTYGIEEMRISPGTTQAEWTQAWSLILSAPTPWSVLCELRHALAAPGGYFVTPAGATPSELTIIERVSRGERPDKISWVTEVGKGKHGCPKCKMQMSLTQRGRLKANRIATCDNGCGNVVVDLSM